MCQRQNYLAEAMNEFFTMKTVWMLPTIIQGLAGLAHQNWGKHIVKAPIVTVGNCQKVCPLKFRRDRTQNSMTFFLPLWGIQAHPLLFAKGKQNFPSTKILHFPDEPLCDLKSIHNSIIQTQS